MAFGKALIREERSQVHQNLLNCLHDMRAVTDALKLDDCNDKGGMHLTCGVCIQ